MSEAYSSLHYSSTIAKAVKKGYIRYATDENDKRKRFLIPTDRGKEVLNDFETIAFNQTQEALLTLSEDEIEIVYQGVELCSRP